MSQSRPDRPSRTGTSLAHYRSVLTPRSPASTTTSKGLDVEGEDDDDSGWESLSEAGGNSDAAPSSSQAHQEERGTDRDSLPPLEPMWRSAVTTNEEDESEKSCWICLDSELAASQRWVYPCTCTLVAHEDCLLTWVAAQQASSGKGTVTCPQCKIPYEIQEDVPPLLHILNLSEAYANGACSGLILSTIAGSVILTSGTFGYLSFRSFMGRDATRAVLGSRPPLSWPFWALFSVPLLPYVQILSAISSDILSAERFHIIEKATILLPFFFLPRPYDFTHDLRVSFSQLPGSIPHPLSVVWSFPPSPGLTLALLPALNVLYLAVKRRVTRTVLEGRSLFSSSLNNRLSRRERRRRLEAAQALLEDEAGEGEGAGGNEDPRLIGVRRFGTVQIELVELDHPPEDAPFAEDDALIPPTRDLYLTRIPLSRLACGALVFPGLASLTGWGLAWLGDRYGGSRTRRFLGLSALVPAVLLGGKEAPQGAVWWRSALGGMLVTVLQDSINLLHKYLRLKQRKTRHVKSRASRRSTTTARLAGP